MLSANYFSHIECCSNIIQIFCLLFLSNNNHNEPIIKHYLFYWNCHLPLTFATSSASLERKFPVHESVPPQLCQVPGWKYPRRRAASSQTEPSTEDEELDGAERKLGGRRTLGEVCWEHVLCKINTLVKFYNIQCIYSLQFINVLDAMLEYL